MPTTSNARDLKPEDVTACYNAVADGYEKLRTALGTDMQSKVIDALSEVWYADNAVSYWNEEVTSWNSMCTQIKTLLQGALDSIKTAFSNYITASGSSLTIPEKSLMEAKISNKFTASRGDGAKGITDLNTFSTVKDSTLNTIKNSADEALNSILIAYNNSGFEDARTEASLRTAVSTAKTKIAEAIETAKQDIAKNAGTAFTNYESAENANASSN